MIDEKPIRTRYQAVRRSLDERGRRLHAAAEALTAGHGGVAATSRATKVARSTIGRGIKDLREPGSLAGKVRRKGAGRPAITTKDPTLLDDLRQLLEPATMGDPMRPLRWVSKSHEKLATALRAMGHKVSASSIPKLLGQLGYRRVYDVGANIGYVSLGIGHDTAQFAVNAARLWSTGWAASATRPPARSWSRPTAAAQTVRVCGSGRSNCNDLPTRPA